MPELAFVLGPDAGGAGELAEALASEARVGGVETSVRHGGAPVAALGVVVGLVLPRDAGAWAASFLAGGGVPPRTIAICAEPPGTLAFERDLAPLSAFGAVFDLCAEAAEEHVRRGVAAEHLRVGGTPRWDHLRPDVERDVDVLVLGAADARRQRVLAGWDDGFWRWTARIEAGDVAPEERWELLLRSRVVLDLRAHDEDPWLDWPLAVQAMANGCVVVAEHAADLAGGGLVAGRHLAVGRAEALGVVASGLLEDGPRWWAMQTAAYEHVRSELRLATAGAQLAAAAGRLEGVPLPDAPVDWPAGADEAPGGPPAGAFPAPAVPGLGAPGPATVAHRTTGYWTAPPPRVSVLAAEPDAAALDALARGTFRDWELVAVGGAAPAWLAAHDTAPGLLLDPAGGDGNATALATARGEACLFLAPGRRLRPDALARLVGGLEAAPGAPAVRALAFAGDRLAPGPVLHRTAAVRAGDTSPGVALPAVLAT